MYKNSTRNFALDNSTPDLPSTQLRAAHALSNIDSTRWKDSFPSLDFNKVSIVRNSLREQKAYITCIALHYIALHCCALSSLPW